jgi:hypothetical protein
MAKARKGTRKGAGKPAAKRSGKKTKRKVTAKLKGRKVKVKAPTAKRTGVIAGALDVIADTVHLRNRLGRNRFEDQ